VDSARRASAEQGPCLRRSRARRPAAPQHEAILARAAAGDARGTANATRENWLELGALVERSLG
jgi:DNA-binding GntR family transcriptional regulator